MTPLSSATSQMARTVSFDMHAPVGLDGVLTRMSLVRGVIFCWISSTSGW